MPEAKRRPPTWDGQVAVSGPASSPDCEALLRACSEASARGAERGGEALLSGRATLAALARQIRVRRRRLARGSTGGSAPGNIGQLELKVAALQASLDAELSRVRSRISGLPRIVLFGKTKAGKTTLRNALTGGDGEGIGLGQQRASREVSEHAWGDVVLADAPGVAALGGEIDAALAIEAASGADLVIYVADDDAIREEEVLAIARLRATGAPVVVALNVKFDLGRPRNLERFLADPGIAFRPDAVEGHRLRLDVIAARAGLPRLEPVPIHAQAAFLATRAEHARHTWKLWHSSGVDALIAAVAVALGGERMAALRLRATQDRAIQPLREAAAALEGTAPAIREQAALAEDLADRLAKGLRPLIDATRREAAELPGEWLRKAKAEVQPFLETNIESPDVGTLWETTFRSYDLPGQEAAWKNASVNRLMAEAAEIELDVAASAAFTSGAATINHFGGWNWRLIAGLAGGVVAVATLAASGLWAFGLGAAFALGVPLIPKQSSRRKLACDDAATKLLAHLDRIQSALEAHLTKWVDEIVERRMTRALGRLDVAASDLQLLERALLSASASLWGLVDKADRALLEDLLRHQSASPLGDDVIRCVRSPGVGWKLLVQGVTESGPALEGEPVHAVRVGDPATMVADSLRPARVDAESVWIEHALGVLVVVEPGEMEAATGARGANLAAASRLLGTTVRLTTSKEAERRHAE